MNEQPSLPPQRGLLYRLFVAHPQAAGECYWRHLWFALRTGTHMIFFALCLMLHGIFPFLCEKTASNYICRLYSLIEERRQKLADCDKRRGIKAHD